MLETLSVCIADLVLDPPCDSPDFDWDLENGGGSDAVLTGIVSNPVGVR